MGHDMEVLMSFNIGDFAVCPGHGVGQILDIEVREMGKERPFFGSLVSFMTSGPVVLMVLEGENAVEKNRKIMGATNPANAEEGTLRKLYAKSIEANAVHGSDSLASADREINYFFDKNEVVARN